MDISSYLGKPESLERWLEICEESPGQQYWLLFKDQSDDADISLETLMYPITGDTGYMTDNEFLEFDSSIHKNGYSNFLNLDQLEDIISNLRSQKVDCNKNELMDAVDYYFSNDAFMSL